MTRTMILGLLCGALGCSSGLRGGFDDTAAMFHDDLRWGRLPAAETTVDSAMREAFQQHHRAWGTVVHVMDLEVEAMRAQSSRGLARVRVVWTRGGDSTDVRESTVEETWETQAGAWRLRNETVVAGDPGVFGTPSASAATTHTGD